MTITRRALCVVYGLTSVLALIGTWGNNLRYLNLGFFGANVRFWQDTLANPASRSITVDIFFLSLAATVWMLLEARRLSMRGAWLYVLLSFLIAVSVTFPVFLINRERALSKLERSSVVGGLRPADIAGLLLLAVGFSTYTVVTLTK